MQAREHLAAFSRFCVLSEQRKSCEAAKSVNLFPIASVEKGPAVFARKTAKKVPVFRVEAIPVSLLENSSLRFFQKNRVP